MSSPVNSKSADCSPPIRALSTSDVALQEVDTEISLSHSKTSHYQTLIEWSPLPTCVNLNGVVEYVNPATVILFGAQSADELTGRPMIDFVHPEYRAAALERRTAVEGGADSVPMREMAFLKTDGSTIFCEAQGLAVSIDGQRAILITMHDITQRKLIEAALERDQDRLQRVLSVSRIGLWEWELKTRQVYFSPEWKRNLGYEELELADTFDVWTDRIHEDDIETVKYALDEFIAGRRPKYEIEFRMRHRDESWHWYWIQADAIRNREGKALRIVGTQIDITKRRCDEDALRENELRLKLALRGANLGLWDWDAVNGTMFVNTLWMTMLGMNSNAPRPGIDDWHARVHPDDLPRLEKLQAEIYLNPQLVDFEIEIRARHEDGTYRWIIDKGQVAARDAEGKPLRIVGTHLDVTASKATELLRTSLEAQLRESQKMQAIGTLAGGVAHDFNNIIAAILGNAKLARDDTTDTRVLESLVEIERAGKRGRDLVRQILSFSRRQPIAKRPTQLVDVLNESVSLLRATLPARISLELNRCENVPLVLADATQIEQVIVNLANNAMHAIHHNQGKISISLEIANFSLSSVDEQSIRPNVRAFAAKWPGESIRLSVTDNGSGMDPVTLERIFEPFFTTKPVNEGTGLGLSVVHGIIESHGGTIDVMTQLGKGSCFTIYLPIDLPVDTGVEEHSDLRQPAPSETVSVLNSHKSRSKILYIDDDEAVVFLVERLLSRRGFVVAAFQNQELALAELAADPAGFALVVTDYNMPGMSGIEVATKARELRHDLPVAIASGYVDESLRQKAASIGIHDLLFKETVVDEFCDAISRLLSR